MPYQIRNPVTDLMAQVGYGKGYQYAHDSEEGVTDLVCLPERLAGTIFYRPHQRGFEREIRKRIAYWESVRCKQRGPRSRGKAGEEHRKRREDGK